MELITFFDTEVSQDGSKILDIGSIRSDGATFHKNDISGFYVFIKDCRFLCGHNIIKHDLKYLRELAGSADLSKYSIIDTLLFSPLLFPGRPYHRLLKDDKIQSDELNNPLNDSLKAKELFFDEVSAFNGLDLSLKTIFFNLLRGEADYVSFFEYIFFKNPLDEKDLEVLIFEYFSDKFCAHADILYNIRNRPIALAYALALVSCNDRHSITPPWILRTFPEVEQIVFLLCNNPCTTGCSYCEKAFDPFAALKEYFGYTQFRTYNNDPLQENAVNAAIRNKSLLAIFPTGGGKSITFQIPALMSGHNARALTVVISPLQSLMKDQVDNLDKKGITEAVTINGLLDPIDRSKAIERVENGNACILYISPESLRSVTIERLLLKRKIARFVIDEAHCFSSWGQDFRVDYLYIGDFIKELQKKKNLEHPIPVSCFTATAKQKVVEDIRAYFREKLEIDLELFRANASRTNLHYRVFQKNNEEDKYNQLRNIIESKDCPTIVYVSRTRKANKLAKRLSEDGHPAKPYHGKMDKDEKTQNQNDFMAGEVNIMVATSAFGMGVDKSDVGAVIHYDISDSLENYIQEAGRAGRDDKIDADCYVLFNEDDLDKHFILLNQTKISSKEINQVWRAIKDLTKTRDKASNSALEIARKAGWDDSISEIETRVVTAIAALEDAGYLKRGQNMPRVYASSILSKTAQEAIDRINASQKIEESLKTEAIRIIKKLFSSKSKRLSTEEQAESRIDYISDQLGIVKEKVIRVIELLREEQILANNKDLTAFIRKGESSNKSLNIADTYARLENFLHAQFAEEGGHYHLKEINEKAILSGIKESTPAKLKTIINFWAIKNWIEKHFNDGAQYHVKVQPKISKEEMGKRLEKRHELAMLITDHLFKKAAEVKSEEEKEDTLVEFSVQELKDLADGQNRLFGVKASLDDIEDTLFYLSRIESIKIEGGFLVVHNKLTIDRLKKNNRIQYKESDYEKLNQFYQQKVQQIHIVGEYAKKMIRNYNEALRFVEDYFSLNYTSFLNKYFPGSRQDEIKRTLTPEKFKRLFGDLSVNQMEIVNDKKHQYIVVAAGPGSGKTRLLVHKLASLLLAEDVKHEQLLMLTFSRAAATEFKKRLMELIGNAASYIEIKTFHSYCFDLLGRIGSLEQADNVIRNAIDKIKNGDIEVSRITKTVLVVDEAQDMNQDEFDLVKVLMEFNEEMRVILVGDDDQNIYAFRGADSKFMQQLLYKNNAIKYELTENYRSRSNIVSFANQWAATISNRLKSQPGFASREHNGNISITQYSSNNLIIPVTTSIAQTDLSGSTCVLTKTNEDAMLMTGLLLENGIRAKLIQTNEGFSLANLYEIRYFSDIIMAKDDSPLISPETWSEAVNQLSNQLWQSNKREMALNIIGNFGLVNNNRKYKTDWKSYLYESNAEDFINIDQETVYVSTIHKAKGKEFDNVFIMLTGFRPADDDAKRQLYVAITRAKSNLHLHYNDAYLKGITAENLEYSYDNTTYPEPANISLVLNLRDINLGYFEFVQHRLNGLYAGTSLTIIEQGLGNENGQPVLKFSRSFTEELKRYYQRGYKLIEAKVNFIVYWNNQDSGKESKVLLPELSLLK